MLLRVPAWRRSLAFITASSFAPTLYAASATADSPASPPTNAYKYIVVGGGAAAVAALNILTSAVDPSDPPLLLISSSLPDLPSPSLPHPTFLSRLAGTPAPPNPELLQARVASVSPSSRSLTLSTGAVLTYERLLLAPGGAIDEETLLTRAVAPAAHSKCGYAHASAWKKVDAALADARPGADTPHCTVVGGSWVALSEAAALLRRGVSVSLSYAEPACMARHFPKYICGEVVRRLGYVAHEADVGVDFLAFSRLKYVTKSLVPGGLGEEEVMVHMGLVFDSHDLVQFRSDVVMFAPTLLAAQRLFLGVAVDDAGRWVANSELSLFSDVYAAGSCVSVGGGKGRRLAPWSKAWAERTGVHAARNMLGQREAFVEGQYSSYEVDVSPLKMRLKCFGSVDGGLETYGFFMRSRERGVLSAGGDLLAGLVFYLEGARADRVRIVGCCVWDGLADAEVGLDAGAAAELVMSRLRDIEVAEEGGDSGEGHSVDLDICVKRQSVAVVLQDVAEEVFASAKKSGVLDKKSLEKSEGLPTKRGQQEDRASSVDIPSADASSVDKGGSANFAVDVDITEGENPVPVDDQRPSLVGKFARFHRPARSVPLRDSEVMFMGDENLGAISGVPLKDKKNAALDELTKKPWGSG